MSVQKGPASWSPFMVVSKFDHHCFQVLHVYCTFFSCDLKIYVYDLAICCGKTDGES